MDLTFRHAKLSLAGRIDHDRNTGFCGEVDQQLAKQLLAQAEEQGIGLSDQSHSFVGVIGPLGDEHRLVNAAWDNGGLGREYSDFIATYVGMKPNTDRECSVLRNSGSGLAPFSLPGPRSSEAIPASLVAWPSSIPGLPRPLQCVECSIDARLAGASRGTCVVRSRVRPARTTSVTGHPSASP